MTEQQDGGPGNNQHHEYFRRFMENNYGQIPARDPSGLLDESFGECEALHGGSEFTGDLGLRQIRDRSLEDYQSLEDELETLVGRYVRSIIRANIPSTRRYVSDVLLCNNEEDRRRLHRWLDSCGSTYRGGLFLWVYEGNHYHVVHDCPWSNASCRCKWHQEAVSFNFKFF